MKKVMVASWWTWWTWWTNKRKSIDVYFRNVTHLFTVFHKHISPLLEVCKTLAIKKKTKKQHKNSSNVTLWKDSSSFWELWRGLKANFSLPRGVTLQHYIISLFYKHIRLSFYHLSLNKKFQVHTGDNKQTKMIKTLFPWVDSDHRDNDRGQGGMALN